MGGTLFWYNIDPARYSRGWKLEAEIPKIQKVFGV
jgi:hypothetical protein